MAYIIFVNPVFLCEAGMEQAGAILATCIATAGVTILMGIVANYPIAVAPGMGLNAFFAFTICKEVGWEVGLGVVFLTGVLFLGLTLGKVRQLIARAVPAALRVSSAVGIGMFIALIGFQHAGIVVVHPVTGITMGRLDSPAAQLAVAGIFITFLFVALKIRTAIFWGMIVTATIGIIGGLIELKGPLFKLPTFDLPGLKIDIIGALQLSLIPLIISLLFFDMFDTLGTLMAIGEEGGFIKDGKFPRLGRAMSADALGTCFGAVCGTSTVTSYIESATGVAVGARTGLANMLTGALFILALFAIPLVACVGAGIKVGQGTLYPVTAPALIVVGILMARSVTKVQWDDMTESVPAFLTMVIMPFTYNISHGLAAGFISYAVMKLFSGRVREAHPIVYILAVIFVARYAFLKI
jgi:AGZA family xanthine/uracil permease-like MFS transporter